MVVLEEGSMLTTGHNQYLQPDYLSPLPTTVSIALFPPSNFSSNFSSVLSAFAGERGRKDSHRVENENERARN